MTPQRKAARRAPAEPRTSGQAVRKATGADREAWFKRLDSWGATERSHRDIAAWLMREHSIDNWWAQTLTVDYEQARGLREPGGQRDGTFGISASKTIAVPIKRLFSAFTDAKLRERWLPGAEMRERTRQPGKSLRYDWQDDTRVAIGFIEKADGKSSVGLLHERLPSAKAAQKAKTFWRARLAVLKSLLEG
jgi:hypothetical protein